MTAFFSHRCHVRDLRRARQSGTRGRRHGTAGHAVRIAVVDFVVSQFIDTGISAAWSPSPARLSRSTRSTD